MRYINKICNRATRYYARVQELCDREEECTTYYSTHRDCKSIKANLLLVQGGVCAYTEIRLDVIGEFDDSYWRDGEFVSDTKIQGHIDHFDSSLRKRGRESWLWQNLFLVHSDVNIKKGEAEVFDILKPDRDGYDPFILLDYDTIMHKFVVNPGVRDATDISRIEHMIEVLGLNLGFVARLRKLAIGEWIVRARELNKSLDDVNPNEFFTAFEFTKRKL